MQFYRAQYIYPVSSLPISDGIVAVEGERIAGVGQAAEMLSRYPGAQVRDMGRVMLMPQAVNAHTHLELTVLAELGKQQFAYPSFVQWIVELVRTWRTIPHAEQVEGARLGCDMLLESGTAAVGDISNTKASLEPLLESGLYGVIYYELIGANPADARQLLQKAQEQVRRWRREYGEERIRFGVTLHTPFTISAELFRVTVPWVIEEQVPFCIHAAESPAETEFLLYGTGEVVSVLAPPDIPVLEWIPPSGLSPIAYLDGLGVLATQPLLVHGVQVDHNDLLLLAKHGVPMAHCPRSNFLLNCGRMPIEAYTEAGVVLGMGTDSLSSSPSLSVWEEVVSAVRIHRAAGISLDPHDMLRICTLDGARALGFEHLLGSLEPGKLARLAVGKRDVMGRDDTEDMPTADEMLGWLWEGEVTVTSLRLQDR